MEVVLSLKERMILEDQKSHEQLCIEKYSNYSKLAKDSQLKQICNVNAQVERNHLDNLNQLLSGTMPQMNQQQNQKQNEKFEPDTNITQSGGINMTDKDICSDLLMSEKYVSETYDKAIFEIKDTRVRDILNHIQKEEQGHGESITSFMGSKGMFSIQ